jgi:2'-5' RNA ligase
MGTGLGKEQSMIPSPEAGGPGLQRRADKPEARVRAEGDRRVEYLLVIYPDGDLNERLQEEQRQFLEDYDLRITVRNKPHITVAVFQAGEGMEDTLLRWIQRICMRRQSFEVMLNNYSGLPPDTSWPPVAANPQGQSFALDREYANFSQRIPGTIYLRVQDPAPFRQLAQELRAIDEFIRSSGCPPMHLMPHPYLSIAGGLTEQVYSKAMPDYSRKTFHGSFPVRELVLLKRDHPFDPCKTVNVFRLSPEGHTPVSSAWRLPKH